MFSLKNISLLSRILGRFSSVLASFVLASVVLTSTARAASTDFTKQQREKIYSCVLEGSANDLFDKNIRLEITADNRFLTFYGDEGENCNGQRDDQYRQRPPNPQEPPQPKYYRFLTDCEREDGFIQILTSQALYDGAESGSLKMRIRGAFFHQRYYSCSSGLRL